MSEPVAGQELLVLIVLDHHQVEELLTGFLELGIRGATVLESRGMGSILSNEVPIFAGFRSLFPGGGAGTFTIFSVLSEDQVGDAIRLAEEVCGDFSQPGTGVLFTLPVRRIKGLAAEIQ